VVIHINGKENEVAPDISVAQLLEDLEIRPGRVVVELNAEVLSRDAHDATHLKQGDEVEIVQFVGGG
jgi:sulfur carrier protein